ncbi:hypothetical protein HMPREF2883_03670 [Actinomyces sp. HMSC075C01]|uniref:Uncharacterized protein n=1 Tax=Actinomyces oris TaxID=544580 RepID=A0A1Q8WD66_9ACTO|nr:hypothetical protein HMPREF2883_03670 [Actinomyces sp. HMSC075C01]OLO54245.1 hypothetical protein BKH27_04500 [Actinomyces oris]OLO63467.1 hypothetical protein BKH22_08580 [Actinomyces oris]
MASSFEYKSYDVVCTQHFIFKYMEDFSIFRHFCHRVFRQDKDRSGRIVDWAQRYSSPSKSR